MKHIWLPIAMVAIGFLLVGCTNQSGTAQKSPQSSGATIAQGGGVQQIGTFPLPSVNPTSGSTLQPTANPTTNPTVMPTATMQPSPSACASRFIDPVGRCCMVNPVDGTISGCCYNHICCPDIIGHCKPVVYLYPDKPMTVSVVLKPPGPIVVSDPHYPPGGWQNIFALPNGTLFYEGGQYHELFYEADVGLVNPPKFGIVMRRDEILPTLTLVGMAYGLNITETKEFSDYWTPKLTAANAPYIFMTVLDALEKQRIDRVEITPKPDTFITFSAYFRPLKSWQAVDPLWLPIQPVKRTGFTAVDWGGIMAHE